MSLVVNFGPDTPDEEFGTMDEIDGWLDEYIINHLQHGEDFDTEKQKFIDNQISEV